MTFREYLFNSPKTTGIVLGKTLQKGVEAAQGKRAKGIDGVTNILGITLSSLGSK